MNHEIGSPDFAGRNPATIAAPRFIALSRSNARGHLDSANCLKLQSSIPAFANPSGTPAGWRVECNRIIGIPMQIDAILNPAVAPAAASAARSPSSANFGATLASSMSNPVSDSPRNQSAAAPDPSKPGSKSGAHAGTDPGTMFTTSLLASLAKSAGPKSGTAPDDTSNFSAVNCSNRNSKPSAKPGVKSPAAPVPAAAVSEVPSRFVAATATPSTHSLTPFPATLRTSLPAASTIPSPSRIPAASTVIVPTANHLSSVPPGPTNLAGTAGVPTLTFPLPVLGTELVTSGVSQSSGTPDIQPRQPGNNSPSTSAVSTSWTAGDSTRTIAAVNQAPALDFPDHSSVASAPADSSASIIPEFPGAISAVGLIATDTVHSSFNLAEPLSIAPVMAPAPWSTSFVPVSSAPSNPEWHALIPTGETTFTLDQSSTVQSTMVEPTIDQSPSDSTVTLALVIPTALSARAAPSAPPGNLSVQPAPSPDDNQISTLLSRRAFSVPPPGSPAPSAVQAPIPAVQSFVVDGTIATLTAPAKIEPAAARLATLPPATLRRIVPPHSEIPEFGPGFGKEFGPGFVSSAPATAPDRVSSSGATAVTTDRAVAGVVDHGIDNFPDNSAVANSPLQSKLSFTANLIPDSPAPASPVASRTPIPLIAIKNDPSLPELPAVPPPTAGTPKTGLPASSDISNHPDRKETSPASVTTASNLTSDSAASTPSPAPMASFRPPAITESPSRTNKPEISTPRGPAAQPQATTTDAPPTANPPEPEFGSSNTANSAPPPPPNFIRTPNSSLSSDASLSIAAGEGASVGEPDVSAPPVSPAASLTSAADKKLVAGVQANPAPSTANPSTATPWHEAPIASAAGSPAAPVPSAAPPAIAPPQIGSDAAPELPKTHQMIDSAPPALPTPLAAPATTDAAATAQMHVGLRTDAFGSVEIHTVVQQSQIGITVHSDREIAHWFSSEVPGLESGLNKNHLNLTAVDFDSGRSGTPSAGSFQHGQPRQNFSETPGSQSPFSPGTLPETDAANDASPSDSLPSDRSFRPGVTRVSIHA